MRLICAHLPLAFICALSFACGKKKKQGDAGASIQKSTSVSASLNAGLSGDAAALIDSGSMVQSFTPASLKIAIFSVSLCDGDSSCMSIYSCPANTAEGCGVELSKIDAFVDAVNAGATSIDEGDYNYIAVSFCSEDNRDEIQHITLNGTVKIAGTDYATDPTSGLIAGTAGKDVSINLKGGCASRYSLSPAATVSSGATTIVKMFFDASLYAYGGVSGGASNTDSYNDGGSCVGNSSAYVCASVVTVVSTVDAGTPTTEHYLIANTETSASNAATASVALYYSSSGTPLGGVQNPYRLSGSSVSWGSPTMNGGLGLVPKTVDANTVSFGEPEGSISLADWFKNFKRSTHTGTYTYSKYGGSSAEGSYSATKL